MTDKAIDEAKLDAEHIKYIERKILDVFRIENFQEVTKRMGLFKFSKLLAKKVQSLMRVIYYYNIYLDLLKKKAEREVMYRTKKIEIGGYHPKPADKPLTEGYQPESGKCSGRIKPPKPPKNRK